MEDIPITGLEELESHLQQLMEIPDSTSVDAKLFDEVELQLTGTYFSCLPSYLSGLNLWEAEGLFLKP